MELLAQATNDPGFGWLAPWVQAGSAATIAMLFVYMLVWKLPRDEERRQAEIERRDKREDSIREWHEDLHDKTSTAFMTAVKSICDEMKDKSCHYRGTNQ